MSFQDRCHLSPLAQSHYSLHSEHTAGAFLLSALKDAHVTITWCKWNAVFQVWSSIISCWVTLQTLNKVIQMKWKCSWLHWWNLSNEGVCHCYLTPEWCWGLNSNCLHDWGILHLNEPTIHLVQCIEVGTVRAFTTVHRHRGWNWRIKC